MATLLMVTGGPNCWKFTFTCSYFNIRQSNIEKIKQIDCVVLLFEACMHTDTCPQAHFPQCDKLQQLP